MERFIKISYTGKVKDTGAVFDTSDAKVAKEEGLEKKGRVFKSLPLVVGAGQVITGLDEALEKMKEGDEKSIEISPEKAFGKRNPAWNDDRVGRQTRENSNGFRWESEGGLQSGTGRKNRNF
ncbi:MAG: hypothetical protein A7315_13550 [Candidatus Altiarchaeales archaeon WOR_SM1_79]|nr:MAG: hypothetical protein A7315_13550 [Candidatus Altiarchaeales archaeon WOR_SM1_79]